VKNQLITEYYTAHREELLAFVSSRLHGTSVAEDIVQDVFLRLLTTDKMITEMTLPALVHTIARHLVIDYSRRHTSHEAYEHYIRRKQEIGVSSQESVFSVHEMMEQLERGLARLPENCREVYRLHIYDNMKVSEISLTLGEGYKSVEHRLGIARKAVRQYLRKYA
jgi:RNA polymerase sigma-70 factor (ECF subfamily)